MTPRCSGRFTTCNGRDPREVAIGAGAVIRRAVLCAACRRAAAVMGMRVELVKVAAG